MPKKAGPNIAQILLFPTGETSPGVELPSPNSLLIPTPHAGMVNGPQESAPGFEVVLSGSFRRDIEGLRRTHEELQDLGFVVLSPTHVDPSYEAKGFVFMRGEETESPERIEAKHLDAIQRAALVWLHAPDGYVGLSAALEVGFAHAQGIPVFCLTEISDPILRQFVQRVDSAKEVVTLIRGNKMPAPAPNVRAFQRYYGRVARQRGYERESAQNCLLLMVEEVGELARAIRKREKLVRHGSSAKVSEAQELADVFLYVIHMANILDLDLGSAVRDKEELNIAKFVRSR